MNDKIIIDIDPVNVVHKWVQRCLLNATGILVEGTTSLAERHFISGSYAYNGYPDDWDKEHDIDVVFKQSTLPKFELNYLFENYAANQNREYENDLSLYFRSNDGQVYNFITLGDTKFSAWKEATSVVCAICKKGTEFGKYLLTHRDARVDIFVAIESWRILF